MNKQLITSLTSTFEEHAHSHNGVEFWYARDLQKLLEYKRWDKFMNVIEKAQIACKNADSEISDHFSHVGKTIEMPKGASKEIEDLMLTRYACYLIAQNADPQKEAVAFAQSYFAVQTRKQELLEERILLNERLKARKKLSQNETELSKNIYEIGVDNVGFSRIRSKGDAVLFGGNTTEQMKNKLEIPKSRPLADFCLLLPSLPRIWLLKSPILISKVKTYLVKRLLPKSIAKIIKMYEIYC